MFPSQFFASFFQAWLTSVPLIWSRSSQLGCGSSCRWLLLACPTPLAIQWVELLALMPTSTVLLWEQLFPEKPLVPACEEREPAWARAGV